MDGWSPAGSWLFMFRFFAAAAYHAIANCVLNRQGSKMWFVCLAGWGKTAASKQKQPSVQAELLVCTTRPWSITTTEFYLYLFQASELKFLERSWIFSIFLLCIWIRMNENLKNMPAQGFQSGRFSHSGLRASSSTFLLYRNNPCVGKHSFLFVPSLTCVELPPPTTKGTMKKFVRIC